MPLQCFCQRLAGMRVHRVDGNARRPTRTMSVHLMNMEAGGEAVLVTFAWDGSEARVFDPLVNGGLLRFTVAGNGKMTDSATGSNWDVITGECLWGAMKGARLIERLDKVASRNPRKALTA
jgi:hypothetical protein